MSEVNIRFSTDNAAFRTEEGDLNTEAVASKLHDIAERVEFGATSGVVLDGNGNTVGTFDVEEG